MTEVMTSIEDRCDVAGACVCVTVGLLCCRELTGALPTSTLNDAVSNRSQRFDVLYQLNTTLLYQFFFGFCVIFGCFLLFPAT